MKFLANENFPIQSIQVLRNENFDIKSIAEENPGISDDSVMNKAIEGDRIILTHDSDYGELIYKFGYKPNAGVIYFRIYDFEPEDPGKILINLCSEEIDFTRKLTVITDRSVRQRSY